jgi:hypothetical protein
MALAELAAVAVLATGASDAPRHDVCHSPACVQRVRHRTWRQAVRAYRPWLRRVRQCESGGAYTTNTGNGFFGAYQFTISSWRAVGGWGWPHRASHLHQDYRAVRLLHLQGRGAWPVCG